MTFPDSADDGDYIPMSDLAQLAKDADSIEVDPIILKHPGLPQYLLLFRSDLEFNQVDAWRRKCVTKPAKMGRPEESDSGKFASMVVAGANIGITRDGADVVDSKGNLVTFSNREFQQQFKVATGVDAVKAFIRRDAAIGSLSAAIIERNGFGDEAEAPDPTDGGESSPPG